MNVEILKAWQKTPLGERRRLICSFLNFLQVDLLGWLGERRNYIVSSLTGFGLFLLLFLIFIDLLDLFDFRLLFTFLRFLLLKLFNVLKSLEWEPPLIQVF